MRDPKSLAETPPRLLAGRVEGVEVPDLIWALCERCKTGVLQIQRGSVRRQVYLLDGQVIFASSSDPNDRLGEMLLREGRISLDQLETALAKLRSGKRLGTLLVEDGSLDSEGLVRAVVGQVQATVLDVLLWEEGEYSFHEGALPTQEVITLQMKTAELLLLGIRNVRSVARLRQGVGAPRTVYGIVSTGRDRITNLNLSEAERVVIERLGLEGQSVDRLCCDLLLSSFEVLQALLAFKTLGLIEERDSATSAGGDVREGRFQDGGFAELLVRLGGQAVTGILYCSRASVERSFHLADGRCTFATSTDTEDDLVSNLFRRGVISLRDRDETSRRLLFNKRAGAILSELGVLDESDLEENVRQQIAEIVYDTFRWSDGEYVFLPGPPARFGEITLDMSIPALVAEGVRRIDSWTRVIRGCGGVDHPLILASGYLDLLDAMGAGVEEWEVVNLLKTPQTPRRVCRLTEFDDYRVCQLLWTLRLLGAAEDAAAENDDEVAIGQDSSSVESAARVLEVKEALRQLPGMAASADSHSADADPPPGDAGNAPGAQAGPAVARRAPEAQVPEPEWDPPADVENIILRFNAMHRVVYRAVRAEIGAGAVNFVRSCCHAGEVGDAVDGVELYTDGTWDSEGLRRAIVSRRLEDPWPVFQRLLEQEFEQLEPHLGRSRSGELKQQIWEIDKAGTSGDR